MTVLGTNISEIDIIKNSDVISLEKVLGITQSFVSNAEEQSAAIQGVSIPIDELNQLVNTLEDSMNRFKLESR